MEEAPTVFIHLNLHEHKDELEYSETIKSAATTPNFDQDRKKQDLTSIQDMLEEAVNGKRESYEVTSCLNSQEDECFGDFTADHENFAHKFIDLDLGVPSVIEDVFKN